LPLPLLLLLPLPVPAVILTLSLSKGKDPEALDDAPPSGPFQPESQQSFLLNPPENVLSTEAPRAFVRGEV
jgi:hypothetical protein